MAKEIRVVGAVIVREGAILCARRGSGPLIGLWEFPGGKVERGETPQLALEREIHEELGCSISVGREVTTTTHEYDFGTIHLTTYICELRAGEPHLTEHSASLWLAPDQLTTLQWAPADVPAVDILLRG